MKTINYFYTLILVSFLVSCMTTSNGYMQNSASLSHANFKYVQKNISGDAHISFFLVFGGALGKSQLISDAKANLAENYELKDNQALVNLVVEYEHEYAMAGIFRKVTCTITADVVEFTK